MRIAHTLFTQGCELLAKNKTIKNGKMKAAHEVYKAAAAAAQMVKNGGGSEAKAIAAAVKAAESKAIYLSADASHDESTAMISMADAAKKIGAIEKKSIISFLKQLSKVVGEV